MNPKLLEIVGIVNRYNVAPQSMKAEVAGELESAVKSCASSLCGSGETTEVDRLRNLLKEPAIKSNALATASIATILRNLRE
jgi:hypothetical protein